MGGTKIGGTAVEETEITRVLAHCKSDEISQ